MVAEAAYEARRRTLPPLEERLHLLLIEILFIYLFIYYHNDGHGPPTLLEREVIQYTLSLLKRENRRRTHLLIMGDTRWAPQSIWENGKTSSRLIKHSGGAGALDEETCSVPSL